MRRTDLIRVIGRAAKDAGVEWRLVRQGGEHEIWDLDGLLMVIPRHREVNEVTAGRILRHAEARLGPGWWRT